MPVHPKLAQFKKQRRDAASRARQARARNLIRRGVRRNLKRAYSRSRLAKYNAEVKSKEMPLITVDWVAAAGSEANGPKNTITVIGGLQAFDPAGGTPHTAKTGFKRGLECDNIVGCWITEAYGSLFKYRISYNSLTLPTQPAVLHGLNVKVVHGIYKNTGAKMGAPLTNQVAFHAHLWTELKKELYDSQFSSDHLEFKKPNRRIRVLKKYTLRPKNTQFKEIELSTAEVAICSPPSEGRFKFPKAPLKQKLEDVTTVAADGNNAVASSSWIPFTLFQCDELDAHEGHLTLEYTSKCYWRDQ